MALRSAGFNNVDLEAARDLGIKVARVPAYRDDVFARLLTFPNVLITGHQAFFTREALTNIAETTIANIAAFAECGCANHEVSVEKLAMRKERA